MADATLYYRTVAGVLTSRAVAGAYAEEPELPEGATTLTEADYMAALADVQEQRATYAQELVDEQEAAQQADYEALRASGIPETTARRLTGYTGPDGGA